MLDNVKDDHMCDSYHVTELYHTNCNSRIRGTINFRQTYQATSLTCGAGGGTIDVPRCTITSHLPLYSVQWYTAKDQFGKIAKKSYFFWSHPPYDILHLHIIVCSANIRYNSLFHCLCTVTNTPLYNALLQRKSKSVNPTLSDSVWIVVFVLPLSTINMHHSPRLCS